METKPDKAVSIIECDMNVSESWVESLLLLCPPKRRGRLLQWQCWTPCASDAAGKVQSDGTGKMTRLRVPVYLCSHTCGLALHVMGHQVTVVPQPWHLGSTYSMVWVPFNSLDLILTPVVLWGAVLLRSFSYVLRLLPGRLSLFSCEAECFNEQTSS